MSDFSKEKEVSRRFAEIVRRNEFCQRVAEQLEREFGPCPARRDQLIAWVDEQLDRCTALGVPGDAALAMISEPLEKMPTSLEALSNEHLQEQATKARFAARILHAHFLAQRSEHQWWYPSRLAATSRVPLAAARSTSSAVCTDQQHR